MNGIFNAGRNVTMSLAERAPATRTMDDLLGDPAVSYPLKAVLLVWRGRDPIDAARDAELLAAVMGERADATTRPRHGQ